jgi:hypothetical protein
VTRCERAPSWFAPTPSSSTILPPATRRSRGLQRRKATVRGRGLGQGLLSDVDLGRVAVPPAHLIPCVIDMSSTRTPWQEAHPDDNQR